MLLAACGQAAPTAVPPKPTEAPKPAATAAPAATATAIPLPIVPPPTALAPLSKTGPWLVYQTDRGVVVAHAWPLSDFCLSGKHQGRLFDIGSERRKQFRPERTVDGAMIA